MRFCNRSFDYTLESLCRLYRDWHGIHGPTYYFNMGAPLCSDYAHVLSPRDLERLSWARKAFVDTVDFVKAAQKCCKGCVSFMSP